jgi:2-hydroxy-3-oxopropionate reductase
MTETIGFIGLGIMGQPMALNLVRAGFPLRVYARRPECTAPVVEAGAVACDSAQSVAEDTDIIITMVSDTCDVEEVILGKQGVIHTARPGSLVIDMSTISPEATRRIAAKLTERDIAMLDAPVSGGEQGAIDSILSIMVGGSEEAFQRALPCLEVMGGNIVHIGDNGAGQVAKACNQVLMAQSLAAIGEAFLLAEASGVDAMKVREALLGGFAYSKALESHGLRMLEGQYRPGFKTRLHHKDMRIALETAAELGIALPGAAVASQYLNAAMGQGMAEDDSISIYRLQRKLSALKINDKP